MLTTLKRASLALVLFSVVFGSTQASAEWSREALNRQIDQTNFIVNRGCSGTLINIELKLVLTNYHCVGQFIRTVEREVTKPDGTISKVKRERLEDVPIVQRAYQGHEQVGKTEYLTKIVAHKQTRDLALLQIKADTIPMTVASKVASEDVKILRGDHAYAVGNPSGLDASVTEGIISSVTRTFEFPWALNEKLPMVQYAGGIFGGNSGGSLYNDDGILIGVPAAGHRQATFIGLAIPASIIREFLSEFCFAKAYDDKADDKACQKKREGKDKETAAKANHVTPTRENAGSSPWVTGLYRPTPNLDVGP